MSDRDTLKINDPEVTEERTAELYRAFRQWCASLGTMPSDYLAVGIAPGGRVPFLPAGQHVAQWPVPMVASPATDEITRQRETEMLADIERIITRLDARIPRAIDSMDRLLADIHKSSTRVAA